jgi:ABC-type glycerol-3-phosphate transport system substrate-binding protein
MNTLAITAFAATLFASAISAPVAADETVTLDAPLAGASLSSEEIAMSVYFTEAEGGAFEVVATYLDAAQDQPRRIVMALSDGDNLQFGLPGHKGTLYRFARNGDAVSVSEAPADAALPASPEM